MNPDLFSKLDRVIHEKGRLAIMSALAGTAELSFTELRELLGMTDGNLTTHIRILQEEGFISVTKSFQNRRPLTQCALTKPGREAFAGYIDVLEDRPPEQAIKASHERLFEQPDPALVIYFVMQS